MTRTYTNIGTTYNGTDHLKAKLTAAITDLDWQPLKGGLSVAMMPGEGIKSCIKELKIPKVSHIAISHELAPYGLYGIRGHYKNGDAQIYVVDEGCSIVVVASDFWPKEQATVSA